CAASTRSMPSGRSRYRACVRESPPNGSSANSTPGGRYSEWRGKFGRDSAGLLGGQALIRVGLEAGTGVQVLAHDHVLDLHRLDQQGPQLLAVVDDKLCFRHDGLPTGSARTASPEVFWRAAGHDHPSERGSFPASPPSGTGSNRAGGAGDAARSSLILGIWPRTHELCSWYASTEAYIWMTRSGPLSPPSGRYTEYCMNPGSPRMCFASSASSPTSSSRRPSLGSSVVTKTTAGITHSFLIGLPCRGGSRPGR